MRRLGVVGHSATHAAAEDAGIGDGKVNYRVLLERVPAITYDAEVGAEGQWHYVSPQIQAVLGYTPDEWREDPALFFSRIHPDDQERYLEAEQRTVETGEAFSIQYRMRARDGRMLWVRDEAVAVPGSGGRLLQGVMYDITDLVEAREALRESEDRYRSLVELSPDAILVHSEGVFVFANQAAARLLGAERPDDLVGVPILEIVHPDSHGVVLGRVDAGSRGESAPLLEERFVRLDGAVVEVEVAAIPLTFEGRPAGQIVVRDITERKRVERELIEAQSRYRTLVETIPMVTYIDRVEEWSTAVYMSPQVEEMLGYPVQAWESDPQLWVSVLHPEDRERVMAEDAERRRSLTPWHCEYRMIARDGRVVWVRDAAVVLFDQDGRPRYWQGVLLDITERKEVEEGLERALVLEREAAARLRHVDEMKSTFLHAVSHELRTPLAAVLGFALTLEREDIRLSPEDSLDIAGRIASNARKLERLLTDLLDLDRLDRGIIAPRRSPTDVGALVRQLVAESELATERRVFVEAAPVVLAVEPAKVERIVENLVANAVRHTPAGARVWIRVDPCDGGAVIVVEDDGPGVPPDLREAIFEPFSQGPRAPRHSPGVAIGLSLVARFAELHGGRAWVEERPGGGASFRVFLPS
jgi:PAS domain S-box-containing protein